MQTRTQSIGAIFGLMVATGIYAAEEDQSEALPQPAYTLIDAGETPAPQQREHPCELRSRAFDKAACRAAHARKRSAAFVKPQLPKSDWKAANTQLTSNLQWY